MISGGKRVLPFLAAFAAGLAGAATFTARVILQDPDRVEPSTLNEAEHALDLAEAYLARHPNETNRTDAVALTNGLSKTEIVRKLVALQRADGHWPGTNATFTCCEILREIVP